MPRQGAGQLDAPGNSPVGGDGVAARNKFSPGPWHIGPYYLDDAGHREIAIQAANGRGGVCTPASVVLQFPHIEGMQEANAHLIAAAPDLYEALEALVETAVAEVNEKGGAGGSHLARLTDARAALSKARGESNRREESQELSAHPSPKGEAHQ